METYYSFPTIDRFNNCFTYSPNLDPLWFDIIIPEGSYHVEDINVFIRREIRKNDHYDKANDKNNTEISANTYTLKSEMFLKYNYEVDFRKDKSINSLLRCDSNLYTSGFHESENMVIIFTINSILVNIDIISGSYVNDSTQPAMYSFFPDVSPGYKIIENPHNLLCLPITSDTIHSISIWLTDQNGNDLNLRGENLSMRFHLREILKISCVLKMIHYTNIKMQISEGQKDKIKKAFESNSKSITIRLKFSDLYGEDVIALTKSQVDRLVKAYEAKKGMTIRMSKTQLVNNMKIEGGFYRR